MFTSIRLESHFLTIARKSVANSLPKSSNMGRLAIFSTSDAHSGSEKHPNESGRPSVTRATQGSKATCLPHTDLPCGCNAGVNPNLLQLIAAGSSLNEPGAYLNHVCSTRWWVCCLLRSTLRERLLILLSGVIPTFLALR